MSLQIAAIVGRNEQPTAPGLATLSLTLSQPPADAGASNKPLFRGGQGIFACNLGNLTPDTFAEFIGGDLVDIVITKRPPATPPSSPPAS